MGWYKLVFKQNQPIHVGSAKWGVIKETEIFIPGSTMWGALTNAYLQKKGLNGNSIDEINEKFETISNFFPSFDKNIPLQPAYQKGEFGYLYKENFIPEDKFRFYFVDTLVQTAIEPISRQAKDESLHELDYILPKPKQKLEYFKDNLYWIGIINNELVNFLKGIKNIFVGADVRYGYGELELIECKPLENNDKIFWWVEDEIKITKDKFSPYFVEMQDGQEIEGEIILIPDFDFRENIPKVKNASFFANIGSKIKSEKNDCSLQKGKIILE